MSPKEIFTKIEAAKQHGFDVQKKKLQESKPEQRSFGYRLYTKNLKHVDDADVLYSISALQGRLHA